MALYYSKAALGDKNISARCQPQKKKNGEKVHNKAWLATYFELPHPQLGTQYYNIKRKGTWSYIMYIKICMQIVDSGVCDVPIKECM